MSTKITFIIDNPTDPTAFEASYTGILKLAAELPDLQGLESAKVWPKDDGTPTPAYRTLDLYFDSYDMASGAIANATARELFGALVETGATCTGLFSDIE